MSKWIEHVKNFSAKKGITYKSALTDDECKRTYEYAGVKPFNKKANYVKYMQSRDDFDITKVANPSANLIERDNAKKRAKQRAKQEIKENKIDKKQNNKFPADIEKNIDMLLTRTNKKKATIVKNIDMHWNITRGYKLKRAEKYKIFIERVLNALNGNEQMTPDILKYCRELIEENVIFEKHKNTPYKKLFKNKNKLNDAINTYIEEQYIPNSVLSQLNSPYEFEKCDFDIPHFIRIYNNGLDEEINAMKSEEMIKKLKSQKIE